MPKLFECDECGSAIEADEDYAEVDNHSGDPGEPKRMLRIHSYLCLPAYHVMHPRGARVKESK